MYIQPRYTFRAVQSFVCCEAWRWTPVRCHIQSCTTLPGGPMYHAPHPCSWLCVHAHTILPSASVQCMMNDLLHYLVGQQHANTPIKHKSSHLRYLECLNLTSSISESNITTKGALMYNSITNIKMFVHKGVTASYLGNSQPLHKYYFCLSCAIRPPKLATSLAN
jgi:hypothetical protein